MDDDSDLYSDFDLDDEESLPFSCNNGDHVVEDESGIVDWDSHLLALAEAELERVSNKHREIEQGLQQRIDEMKRTMGKNSVVVVDDDVAVAVVVVVEQKKKEDIQLEVGFLEENVESVQKRSEEIDLNTNQSPKLYNNNNSDDANKKTGNESSNINSYPPEISDSPVPPITVPTVSRKSSFSIATDIFRSKIEAMSIIGELTRSRGGSVSRTTRPVSVEIDESKKLQPSDRRKKVMMQACFISGVRPEILAALYVNEALAAREYWIGDLIGGITPKLDRLKPPALLVYTMYHWGFFRTIFNVLVVLHCLLMLWEAPNNFWVSTVGDLDENSKVNLQLPPGDSDMRFLANGCPPLVRSPLWTVVLDWLIVCIAAFDVGILLMAIGRSRFFRNSWNITQILITSLLFIDVVLATAIPDSYIPNRYFRCLRPLQLIPTNSALRRLTASLLRTLRSLGNITMLLAGFIMLFALLGMQMRLSLSDTCASSSSKSTEVQNACDLINNFQYFQNFPLAAMNIFVLLTTENYPDVMVPFVTLAGPTFIYFVGFITMANWVVMSVLLAVMFNAFKEAKVVQVREIRETERLYLMRAFMILCDENEKMNYKAFGDMLSVIHPTMNEFRKRLLFDFIDVDSSGGIDVYEFFKLPDVLRLQIVKRKQNKLNDRKHMWWLHKFRIIRFLHSIVDSPKFELAIGLGIVVNLVQMMIQTTFVDNSTASFSEAMNIMEYFLVSFFLGEMAVKILAFGKMYFLKGSNLFDMTLALISLITTVLEFGFAVRPSVIRTVRILRLPRLLRVFSVAKGLRTLIKTFARIIWPLAWMGVYIVIFVYFFAAVAVMSFNCSYTPSSYVAHFNNLPAGMLTNFQLLTESNWQNVMYEVMQNTTFWAAIYFVTFEVFMTYFMFNIVLALIIEAFQMESYSQETLRQDVDPEALEAFNARASFKVLPVADPLSPHTVRHNQGRIYNVRLQRRLSRELVKKESEEGDTLALQHLYDATGMDLLALRSQHLLQDGPAFLEFAMVSKGITVIAKEMSASCGGESCFGRSDSGNSNFGNNDSPADNNNNNNNNNNKKSRGKSLWNKAKLRTSMLLRASTSNAASEIALMPITDNPHTAEWRSALFTPRARALKLSDNTGNNAAVTAQWVAPTKGSVDRVVNFKNPLARRSSMDGKGMMATLNNQSSFLAKVFSPKEAIKRFRSENSHGEMDDWIQESRVSTDSEISMDDDDEEVVHRVGDDNEGVVLVGRKTNRILDEHKDDDDNGAGLSALYRRNNYTGNNSNNNDNSNGSSDKNKGNSNNSDSILEMVGFADDDGAGGTILSSMTRATTITGAAVC